MTEFDIWRGFRHEWLRTVFGFRTPHRISKFSSFVDRSHVTMGQNTGVDGNYMKPVARITRVTTDALRAINSSLEISWTDASEHDFPRAISNLCERVEESVDVKADDEVAVILRGFDLSTSCDPDKQVGTPKNSDGMWPYRFFIALGEVEEADGGVAFDIDIDIARGWTPNRGGVPLIEEKPFNSHLDYDLEIFYTVLVGPRTSFRASRLEEARLDGRARDSRTQLVNHRADRSALSKATVALSGFGFDLERRGRSKMFEHRGRYLGALDFGVSARDRRDHLDVDCRAQVWVPITVWDAPVRYSIEPVLLEFDQASLDHHEVMGSICCPSQGAPWWSAWNGCESDECGPARREDRVEIASDIVD